MAAVGGTVAAASVAGTVLSAGATVAVVAGVGYATTRRFAGQEAADQMASGAAKAAKSASGFMKGVREGYVSASEPSRSSSNYTDFKEGDKVCWLSSDNDVSKD